MEHNGDTSGFHQSSVAQERLKALTLAANLVPSEQSFLAQLKKAPAEKTRRWMEG